MDNRVWSVALSGYFIPDGLSGNMLRFLPPGLGVLKGI